MDSGIMDRHAVFVIARSTSDAAIPMTATVLSPDPTRPIDHHVYLARAQTEAFLADRNASAKV